MAHQRLQREVDVPHRRVAERRAGAARRHAEHRERQPAEAERVGAEVGPSQQAQRQRHHVRRHVRADRYHAVLPGRAPRQLLRGQWRERRRLGGAPGRAARRSAGRSCRRRRRSTRRRPSRTRASPPRPSATAAAARAAAPPSLPALPRPAMRRSQALSAGAAACWACGQRGLQVLRGCDRLGRERRLCCGRVSGQRRGCLELGRSSVPVPAGELGSENPNTPTM